MSLLKILILSSALDPFAPLEWLPDACRVIDESERDRGPRGRRPIRREDPRESYARAIIAAFWN